MQGHPLHAGRMGKTQEARTGMLQQRSDCLGSGSSKDLLLLPEALGARPISAVDWKMLVDPTHGPGLFLAEVAGGPGPALHRRVRCMFP